MPTLWQILTGQVPEEKPTELKFYNPLRARVGNHLEIDTLDLEELDFSLRSLQEINRKIDGETHPFATYILVAKPFGRQVVKQQLRLLPLEDGQGESTHSVLLMDLLDEFEYNKDFHNGLAFENNNGEFLEGDATYWRVNDLQDPWECEVNHISDLDGDGEVEDEEVQNTTMTYWDFWRETEDEAGEKILEFLIVEMDSENGFFRIWIGKEIDQNRVIIS